MKRSVIFTTVSAAVMAAAFSMSAGAQTCAGPAPWHPDTGGNPHLTGSTCAHETGIISVCQGGFGAPGAAFVAQLDITAAGTFTDIDFTGGAGYTYSVYVVPLASGCNADAACTTSASGPGTLKHVNLGPGSYYMIVTGADFDAQGACGAFDAHANGTLPVTLQTFSVG